MSQQSQDFARGVEYILEAVMFENWLRFYFIVETPGVSEGEEVLCISVPEQGMERIREQYAHLLPMAEDLNGKEITFDSSRNAICTFVVTEVDGKRIRRNMSDMVFDSATFQMEMQLFNAWVQAHEEALDKGFLNFDAWKSLFAQWRTSAAVQDWAAKLAGAAMPAQEAKDTVQ